MKVIILLLLLAITSPAMGEEGIWPQFRGPTGQGAYPALHPPISWSETNGVKWKTELPGQGWSSPVIHDHLAWMTTATEEGHSLRAIAVDIQNGKVVHNLEVFHLDNPEFKHDLNSYASPTPVATKDRVFVHFGTYGTAAINPEGQIVWRNEELKLGHENGPGSSPIIYKDKLILTCDGTNVQFMAALNLSDGKLAWKRERSGFIDKAPPMKKAYATPLVVNVGGRDELICPAAEYLYSYEPGTGKELWTLHYPGFSNVPRPVVEGNLMFVATGFGKPEMWAIRLTKEMKGDVTSSAVAWKVLKQAPAKPSPVVYNGKVFMISDNGIATCLDAETGAQNWQERLPGEYSASLLLAGDQIYYFNHVGMTTVLKASDVFTPLSTNVLSEGVMASPALVKNSILLRTKTAIYRIE
ncbi:MAG: Pyrrolo-quinoline quinone repeat-containing protein [Verrucomicrobiales bacterium]|nr:Pyrrolo-quinoline quinone repeat-containing protein [Verrucomicrobiales bacterium]